MAKPGVDLDLLVGNGVKETWRSKEYDIASSRHQREHNVSQSRSAETGDAMVWKWGSSHNMQGDIVAADNILARSARPSMTVRSMNDATGRTMALQHLGWRPLERCDAFETHRLVARFARPRIPNHPTSNRGIRSGQQPARAVIRPIDLERSRYRLQQRVRSARMTRRSMG
ncbi:hypothetical protein ACPVPU_09900 [Sphingomonas sp. CJ99]